jgi:hypothetical protein
LVPFALSCGGAEVAEEDGRMPANILLSNV